MAIQIIPYPKGFQYMCTFQYPGKPFRVNLTWDYKVWSDDGKGHSDHPIQYETGQIVWDWPERVPAYGKMLARAAFRHAEMRRLPVSA